MKTRAINKKTRLIVYEKALEVYEKGLRTYLNNKIHNTEVSNTFGLCANFASILCFLNVKRYLSNPSVDELEIEFPELSKYKPTERFYVSNDIDGRETTDDQNTYWFNNITDRIKVLKEILAELKTENNE